MRFWPFRAASLVRLASYLQSWVNARRRHTAPENTPSSTQAASQPGQPAAQSDAAVNAPASPRAAPWVGAARRSTPPEHWLALVKNAQAWIGTERPVQPEPTRARDPSLPAGPAQEQANQPASLPIGEEKPSSQTVSPLAEPKAFTELETKNPVHFQELSPHPGAPPGSFPTLPLGRRHPAPARPAEPSHAAALKSNPPRITIPRAPGAPGLDNITFPVLAGSESSPGEQTSSTTSPSAVNPAPGWSAQTRSEVIAARQVNYTAQESVQPREQKVAFPQLPSIPPVAAGRVDRPSPRPIPENPLRLPASPGDLPAARVDFPALSPEGAAAKPEIEISAPANAWPALPSDLPRSSGDSQAQDVQETAARELRHIQKLEREQRGQLWNE